MLAVEEAEGGGLGDVCRKDGARDGSFSRAGGLNSRRNGFQICDCPGDADDAGVGAGGESH